MIGMNATHLIGRCLPRRSPALVPSRLCHKQAHGHEDEDHHHHQQHEQQERPILYDSHIPTTGLQKLILAAGSSLMSLADPWRHDMVAVSAETTGHYALMRMMQKMRSSDEGRQILDEKPVINTTTVNFDQLRDMPVSSFGHQYAEFMIRNKITPDSRDPVKFVDDSELAYVMQRYRQVRVFALSCI
jgi:ubiquinone biosynthesis protein Coq4